MDQSHKQFGHTSAESVRIGVTHLIALGQIKVWISPKTPRRNSETLLHMDNARRRQAGGAYSSALPVSLQNTVQEISMSPLNKDGINEKILQEYM